MQASGPYGVPAEFVVQQRAPPSHNVMFTLSHEISHPPTTHGHPHHLQHAQHHQQQQQHQHQQHHHQQQHTQHHHQQQHPQHSQHAQQHGQQHAPHQQQQQQQQQHPQHPHQQHAQHQHQQHQQAQQQAIVQQLGLGPESPEVPSPVASRPSPTGYKQQRDSLGDDDGGEDEGRGTGGNRWPRQETLALIKIRSEMDSNFRDSGLKGPLWEDVSRKLAELGYQRSSKKCKEKFENVHKYYKKTKDGRAGRQDGKSYRFFSQLEALYGVVGGSSSQHGGDGGSLMLTGGSGAAIGGGAEGNLSSQQPAETSSGVQLSSDSEDDYDDDLDDNDEQDKSKKRKRKEGKVGFSNSKMLYLESLVKKLMEKQEAMYRKFLEAIERREQDRLVREESWKRQEMARMTREHELRAQEHALAATRDAALVAFLQKVTGQTLQLPPIAPPQSLAVIVADAHHGDDHVEKDSSFDPNSKRWPKPEVQALIRLRSQMEPRFQEAGPKGPLWEEICTGMACLGYNRNAKRCKEKWENINKYFRKTKETNKKRPDNAKTCPYFHQLDVLYRKGVLGTPNSKLNHNATNNSNKIEDNSDELMDHPSNRDDSEHHGRDADEILAMMPSGDGPPGATTSNGCPTHFFSSPGNGSSNDRGTEKQVTEQPHCPSNNGEHHENSSPSNGEHSHVLSFDGPRRADDEMFSGNTKLVRLEGLLKSILDEQRHQQVQVEEMS